MYPRLARERLFLFNLSRNLSAHLMANVLASAKTSPIFSISLLAILNLVSHSSWSSVQIEVLLFCAAAAFLPALPGLCKGNQTYGTWKILPMANPDREWGYSWGVHLVHLPHVVSISLWGDVSTTCHMRQHSLYDWKPSISYREQYLQCSQSHSFCSHQFVTSMRIPLHVLYLGFIHLD